MTPTTTANSTSERELVIVRTLNAPRALVWKAWTDPEQARAWWGPKGFTTPVCELATQPGGEWHAVMIAPDGTEHSQRGVLREMVPPERLSFTFIWDDTPDVEMLVTVTLADSGDRTVMTFRQTGFPSDASREGHEGGWTETFDRLTNVVERLAHAGE
jgi:uncharacterized protein YndB with AHSA1/START domain